LPPKFEKALWLGFRVRVLIRFTCDSYVFAYVVYCILRYSDVIPVIPVIAVFPDTLTYARLHVEISLFQPQGRSDTVLAASPWQDRPPGILFQHAAAKLTS